MPVRVQYTAVLNLTDFEKRTGVVILAAAVALILTGSEPDTPSLNSIVAASEPPTKTIPDINAGIDNTAPVAAKGVKRSVPTAEQEDGEL